MERARASEQAKREGRGKERERNGEQGRRGEVCTRVTTCLYSGLISNGICAREYAYKSICYAEMSLFDDCDFNHFDCQMQK